MSEKKKLSYFTKRYAFADSVTITGFFNNLNVTSKLYVKNCNFNFVSDNIGIASLDNMFDGCVNAVFSNELRIYGDTITSAASAFRNCNNAKIPVVDISSSKLTNTESMFENCYSAELSGASIPETATRFKSMFKNSKSAFFNDIAEIPAGDGDYEEVFCGCENGVFSKLHFGESSSEKMHNCRFMFYYCGNMDCNDLGLENISNGITDSSYMFYSAGSDGSSTFDDSVFMFSNLAECESMFTKSNFSFDNTFFLFNGNGESFMGRIGSSSITSVSRMFADCEFCKERSPVVVLGHPLVESLDLESVDSALDGVVEGHYMEGAVNSIIDFSGLYENSSFTTLDIRGISHNLELSMRNIGGIQDFSNMCRNCSNMKEIVGFIPQNGLSYESMFDGCTSLSADLSKLFVEANQNYGNGYITAFNKDLPIKSYTFTNLSRMFNGCSYIYSTSDNADIVGIFKKIKSNVGDSEIAHEMVSDMFPPIRIATKNQIPELIGVKYNINGISERTGTVRFNSFSDEKFETEGGNMSEFGLYSEYAKRALSRGFYRYGGQFQGNDSDKCFYIMYVPENGEDEDENTINFSKVEIGYNVYLSPNGWGEIYNTDSSKGFWSEFTFDRLYAGIVCGLNGEFIKYAYIGNYTRIYHEKRKNSGGSYDFVTNYEMPVAFFNGLEDTISPL